MSESIWSQGRKTGTYQDVTELKDHKVQVAIVGGGLTGILTAYLLREKGIQAEVFEADTVGSLMTANTTAKITSQHRLIYDRLITQYGIEKAREYAARNEQAISQYESLITEKRIDCDFKKESAYVYTTKETDQIKAEVKAAKRCGINAYYTEETALPFSIKGAICFQNQAMFHPLKFLDAIAEGLTIWEHARVIRIKKHTLTICVEAGEEERMVQVEANHIVIATHFPILNRPGYYFMRMYQERSYVVAIKQEEALSYGMYVGQNESDYSFRRYGDYILIGGENHRTGLETEKEHIEELIKAAKAYYPESEHCYAWGNQDCMTFDKIPYIGRFSKRIPYMYVATGYNKWGMSTAMVAAHMLSDYISGKEYRADSIFSPSRFDYRASKKEGKAHICVTLKSMITPSNNRRKATSLSKIACGKAGIIWRKGRRVGVYKDVDGTIYEVAIRCPHLGCRLAWNEEEKTWDCPCHGSRFDYKGRMISNPTRKDSRKY